MILDIDKTDKLDKAVPLRNVKLPDIPLHTFPLSNSHDDYQHPGISQRQWPLIHFNHNHPANDAKTRADMAWAR